MNYLPVKSLLSQYDINSKNLCVAQCARLLSTCNIAVYNPKVNPHCVLYGESLTMTNLIYSADATAVDFGRSNLNGAAGVQNRTIICGSFVSSSSADFAKTINSSVFPATSYSLEINQQIASGSTFQVLTGSLGIGTNRTHTITTTNNISYTLDGRTVLIQKGNQGATININTNLTSKCITIQNDIQSLSNELMTMVNTSGNNISSPTSSSGPLIFYVNTVDANGMSVFNMDGNTALNNPLVQTIQIVVSTNVTNDVQLVVINLSGTSISFAQGNMAGTWLSSMMPGQSQTIWNFYQATSITMSHNWMGALLAPYASVTASTSINGATAVKTLVSSADVQNPLIAIPSCV